MSLRSLMQGVRPVTAPLVLNPLMARMAEAAGFPARYLGGGSTGYEDLGALGYRIVADPSTPLLAAYDTWKKIYAQLADGFGAGTKTKPDWSPVEKDMLSVIGLERLLAVERATVEHDTRARH